MTADDDELDDASLKSMRAVWLSMRDEEPPAAGMSALLAAARDKAEAMSAHPSWWQRLFTQLRRPPALAFATVMLLVGGAVLVTRNAEQKVESETAAVAPADELRAREVPREQEAQSAPVQDPALAQPTTTVEKVEPKLRAKKDVVGGKAAKPQPRAGAKTDDGAGPHEPTREDRFDGDATPKSGFAEGTDTTTTVLESPGRVEPATTPQPPPKAAEKATGEQVTLTDSGTVTTPANEQLARQAESAASRGDCPAVRAIVAKLKQQDERFYRTRLGKNAAVTKCR